MTLKLTIPDVKKGKVSADSQRESERTWVLLFEVRGQKALALTYRVPGLPSVYRGEALTCRDEGVLLVLRIFHVNSTETCT